MPQLLLFLILLFLTATAQQPPLPPCGGVERWSIKVLTDVNTGIINFNPVTTTIDNLIQLTTTTPSPSTPRISGIEDKVYIIRCHITIKKTEDDDDYHLVLSDTSGNTLIGEVPDPLCSTVASSPYVNSFIAARHFVDANIASGNVSNVSLPEVEVTGVAFVDVPHGQTDAAPNQMELHPILDIRFAQSVGVQDIPPALLSVTLSPNPCRGMLSLKIISRPTLHHCILQVYDTKASLVAQYNLPIQSENQINTSLEPGLPAGTYIYRILNSGALLYDGKLSIE